MLKLPRLPFVRRRSSMALVCAALLLVACRADGPGLPSGVSNSIIAAFAEDGERLDVCHLTESGKQVIDVSTSAWNAHRLHGDYALAWQVAHDNIAGDGIQFTRISDALDAGDSTRRANGERTSASCRITISVAAGNYVGSYSTVGAALERLPFFIGVPDITLRGASVMQIDGDARATGLSEAGISTIAPDRGLTAKEALIVVADDMDGYHGYGAVIQGFRFTSGYDPTGTASGGIGVGSLRVRDLRVVGNQFDATMLSAVSIRASRAVIDGNYARGLGALCGFCLTGPGHFEVTSNRLIDGGFVGIFLAPVAVLPGFPMGLNDPSIVVAPFVVPPVAAETAVVVNNEVRDHVRQPRGFGTGIRLVAYSANAEGGEQSSHVTLRSNTLLHNNFALVLDANTPPASPTVAGNVTLAIAGNGIGPSCRNNLLVSFTRFSRSIGVPPSTESFLHNTAFKLTLNGNTSWSDAWYDNPDGIGNTLEVDGAVIASGKRTSPSDNPAGC